MANVAKLKKRALDFEQKKLFDKALETYMQILGQLDEHVTEADMALYNRVGDLLLRRGDTAAAVDHYDKAVDLYTESGFFNNAIALCNKVLRNAPGRATVYYKLGRISAKKGFINDAKQNFLEYADRMQQAGDLEEAFRALKEFADLCPDQDDIRLMLADQLVRKDRKPEAIEQLQRLYEKFQTEGRTTEARATLDRMRAIDPSVQPRTSFSAPTPRSSDLVFLDVNYDAPLTNGAAAPPGAKSSHTPPYVASPTRPAPVPPAAPEPPPEPEADEPTLEPMTLSPDLTLPMLGAESLLDRVEPEADGLESSADDALVQDQDAEMVTQVDGLITGFDSGMLPGGADVTADSEASLLDLGEPLISRDMASELLSGESSGNATLDDSNDLRIISAEVTFGDLPMLELATDEEESIGGELDLILPDDDPSQSGSGAGLTDAFAEIDDLAPDVHMEGGGTDDRGSDFSTDPPAAWLELTDEESAPKPVPEPPRPVRATERLRRAIAEAPQHWQLHRRLAEALFEEGDRQGGLRELETAMLGLESTHDLNGARSMAEEIIRVEPNSVRHHQKRVEYAVRANDRTRLVDAYLDLAEALFRIGELDKSRVVYGRVLELAPQDARVRSALDAIGGRSGTAADAGARREYDVPTAPPISAPPRAPDTRTKPVAPAPVPPPRRATPTPRGIPAVAANSTADSFVNLAEWVRDEEEPKSTRMVVDVKEPAHEEQVDFAEMLAMFKQGVEANVDEADHESHYDLGVAYKEMGLLDEAISEFQKALRGAEYRVRSYEALGQCFVEKEQYQIAATLLARALGDKQSSDDVLVGVLYLLGYASEMLKRWADAQRYYERVFAVDIQFRDVRDRLAAVTRASK